MGAELEKPPWLGGINYQIIPELLEELGTQTLVHKTGYILELLKDNSIFHDHLPYQVLKRIEKKGQRSTSLLGKREARNPE
jgi:hypothetical protein